MKNITSEEIIKMVNEINQEKNPNVEKYIDDLFTEYLDIEYLKDFKLTGEEQLKLENAITHLIQVNTLTSVKTTLEVLEKMGIIKSEDNEQ
ncbi:hypothetical protein [Alkalibacillus salilacus]|uniref:Phage protein n=1 Tax=Alkalibacillus salilacus TaxID=284582 RepID=A0ABT9VD18_9BACI|nr:hypothetical protein [Alkalibacillus salilacus]MDQ0158794.1 hypothetical protein [Alkalibacillus salilacus]